MIVAAWVYGVLCAITICFHLALFAGAPWGVLTMGGKYPGRLSGWVRGLPLVSAGLLAGMAAVVLGRAGVIGFAPPGWLFWAVLGFTALTTLANWATPSAPERRLWGPVTLVMLLCVLLVALGLGAAAG